MKIAIVYYSLTGNVRYVVESVAPRLEADVFEIKPRKAYKAEGMGKFVKGGMQAVFSVLPQLEPLKGFDMDAYDVIILATPVWAGRPSAPVLSFVAENPELSGKDVGLIMCSSKGKARSCMKKLKGYIPSVAEMPGMNLVDPLTNKDTIVAKSLADYPHSFIEGYKTLTKRRYDQKHHRERKKAEKAAKREAKLAEKDVGEDAGEE